MNSELDPQETPAQQFPSLPIRHTGLRVPLLGLGGGALSGLYSPVPERQSQETIHSALANGVNFFDTAPLYGLGSSERRLGLGLKDTPRHKFVLATKIGRILTPEGKIVPDYTRQGVLRSLEGSLERLQLERVDILHIHDADSDDHFRTALDEAFPTLADLRSRGVIGAIGAGMNQWQRLSQFMAHADFDCFLLAGRYTLLEQASRDFLNACADRQVHVFLGGVYNTGILATGAIPGAKYNYRDAPEGVLDRVRQIEAVCIRHRVGLKAAALQFPLRHPAVSLVVGMCSPQEVHENITALHQPIPDEFWQDLQAEDLLPQD